MTSHDFYFISPLFTEKNYFSYLTASGLIERKHCIKLGKKQKKNFNPNYTYCLRYQELYRQFLSWHSKLLSSSCLLLKKNIKLLFLRQNTWRLRQKYWIAERIHGLLVWQVYFRADTPLWGWVQGSSANECVLQIRKKNPAGNYWGTWEDS